MIYRFKLVSDEVNGFFRVIDIDPSDTFFSLRKTILETAGYSDTNIDSFFICNDKWEKHEEIALVDMGLTASDHDLWTMDSTRINELVNNRGQKLVFTFDNLNDRSFFMELKEVVTGEKVDKPEVIQQHGKAPKQDMGLDGLLDGIKEEDPKAGQVSSDIFGENADGYSDEDLYGLNPFDESNYN